FTECFVQLFLAGFTGLILMIVGFICLILPGIYLWVAWTFALMLVIDKRLEFWAAMELSRKTVARHWWAFLTFNLILLLMDVVGGLMCYVGLYLACPIATAACAYAYEDIIGA